MKLNACIAQLLEYGSTCITNYQALAWVMMIEREGIGSLLETVAWESADRFQRITRYSFREWTRIQIDLSADIMSTCVTRRAGRARPAAEADGP